MACDEVFYRQYLNGDDAGLEALMEKYGDPLTVYLDGYLHDIHEAEELMLDVFAYLFTKKPRIREGGFKAYLYKAARHMALRHRSKRRLMFSLDALTDEPDGQLLAEEVIGTAERNRILHGCMGEMNPDYREVLYLTYFEGMSYAQAAEVTGKTVKQITNLVYRGKESLRKLLEREGITNAEPLRTLCGNKAAHRRKTAQGTAATQYDHHTFCGGGVPCADRGCVLCHARYGCGGPPRRFRGL